MRPLDRQVGGAAPSSAGEPSWLAGGDVSPQPADDASSRTSSDASRRARCRGTLEQTARRDAIYCSQRCRQAAHRFGRGLVARERAARPLRIAYADPPYPGLAGYYRGHPDYAGEVDHRDLVSRLQGYDGWALSTSADALPEVLSLCPPGVRVASWTRGPRPGPASRPRSAWEPVIYVRARSEVVDDPGADALVLTARPRLTDPGRVVGAKPAGFAWWLFGLLDARPGDVFDDLFPGSGGIGRAWSLYESSLLEPGDGS